ncbi:MAG: serine hydrolase domain-containing protein [Acidobacteriota bacterium]|nr:serine hydrolase domain-containing protein [Acidobacteriota bacterium]
MSLAEATPGAGVSMERVAPEEVGLSKERLARLDTHFERRYLEPGKIAGCLTLVARDGKIAWLSPQGLSDRKRNAPMTEDTLFRIYSMSKPITSVALMALYEEGHFQLDDAAGKIVPALRDLRVYRSGNHPSFLTDPCERPMSVRDLLTHQSGLTYGFMECSNVDAAYRELGIGDRSSSLETMIQGLAELPLEFSPGTRWNYSVATDVCGYLVEVLSGQRFDTFLQERIFDPLGMTDTGFQVPVGQVGRFAANYERAPDKSLRLLDDPRTSPYLEPAGLLSGGGGLVSTATDYARFCQMVLGGGELDGARILSPRTLGLMMTNHLPGDADLSRLASGSFSETTYDGIGFGLGFAVFLDQARAEAVGSPGESYWGGAASTIFWVDPSEDLTVVFMTQFMPSGTFNFRGQLKSIIYGSIVD